MVVKVRRVISLLLVLTVLAISIASIIPAYCDDSSAESGTGTINTPYNAYYQPNEYGWRVSLYVAKTIGKTSEEYLSDSLIDDYYYLGHINIKNPKLTIDDGTLIGCKNKIELVFQGELTSLSLVNMGKKDCFTFPDCPAPPIVCNGNINSVRSFFLNPNKIPDYLDRIASLYDLDDGWEIVSDLDFTFINTEVQDFSPITKTGEEWGADVILPSTENRKNYLPWVLVYEPMVCVYLAPIDSNGQRQKAFLTATEYALAQGFIWNWHTVGSQNSLLYTWNNITYYTGALYPQCVQSLVFKNLPASVTLDTEKNWFGFNSISKQGGEAWTTDEVIMYGGWGMGFLSPVGGYIPEDEGLTVEPAPIASAGLSADASYRRGTEVITSFLVSNTGPINLTPDDQIRLVVRFYENCVASGTPYRTSVIENVSMPAFENGYVWTRWTIGDNFRGNCLILAELIAEDEEVFSSTQFTVSVTDADVSHTPRPDNPTRTPDYFCMQQTPADAAGTLSWYEWIYEDEIFHKESYSVSLSGSALVTPDPDIPSTYYFEGVPVMRSGYALYVTANGNLSASGDIPQGSVTGAQTCSVFFPEYSDAYGWSRDAGEYETAELTSGGFVLSPAEGGKRAHYTPVWFPDDSGMLGNYVIFAEIDDCWTPAGKLSCRASGNPVSIHGSLFDDWYIG